MIYFLPSIIFFLGILLVATSNKTHEKDVNLEKTTQGQMSKNTYQGHTYVVWSINFGGGIVHDPDCECRKINKQN